MTRTLVFPALALVALVAGGCGDARLSRDLDPSPVSQTRSAWYTPTCPETFTPLEVFSSGEKVGYTSVYRTETELVFGLVAKGDWVPGDWVIDHVWIYVGDLPVPVDLSAFQTHLELGGAPAATIVVPLPEDACRTLTIAIKVVVSRGTESVVAWGGGVEWENSENPGWTFGIPFGDREGWYVRVNVCCEPGGGGCTRTQGYWKTHPEAWPLASLELGGVSYTQGQLLTLLTTPVRGDASLNLAHQLIAALLNVASGATAPSGLADAQTWMSTYEDADGRLPYGVRSSSPAGMQAVSLGAQLTSYNEGAGGVPHCDAGEPEAD